MFHQKLWVCCKLWRHLLSSFCDDSNLHNAHNICIQVTCLHKGEGVESIINFFTNVSVHMCHWAVGSTESTQEELFYQ